MSAPVSSRRRRPRLLLLALATAVAILAPAAPAAHTLTIVAQAPTGTTPEGIGVDPATGRVFVANRDSNNVTVLDGRASPITPIAGTPVTAGTNPTGVAVDPVTGRVFVANEGSNNVACCSDDSPRPPIRLATGSRMTPDTKPSSTTFTSTLTRRNGRSRSAIGSHMRSRSTCRSMSIDHVE